MTCGRRIFECGLIFLLAAAGAHAEQSQWVHFDANHTLVYSNDDLGNHIPDFSYAGYMGGGVALPTNVPVKETLNAISGDNTANIQNAINFVGNMPMANGFRGAVLLNPGTYELDGSLTINQSGVVLRGSGSSPTGTVLHFVGNSRQTIAIQGSGSTSTQGSSVTITDPYVPLGATNFHISNASSFSVGNLIIVQRPVTQTWIDAINMSNYWTPGSGLHFERTITAISSNQITVDIPLFNPIEQQWCTGDIYRVTDSSRMTNSAVENLRIRSDFDDFSTNWGSGRALNIDNAKNCWISGVVVDNYYNGINSGGGAKWLTIQDCYFVSNAVPPSSAGSAAFGGSGQMILWQRGGSSDSTDYHVFVTQAAVPGPNVFLNFNSSGAGYDSGAHQRWAAGVLFDNDTIASTTGGNTGIKLENRGGDGSGQGYAAGYSIIYNGNSKGIINEIPPVDHHYNWAIGGAPGATFVHRSDDGIFDATNGFVNPRSLYLEQLKERHGGVAVENIGYKLFSISSTPSSQATIAGATAVFVVNVGDPTLMSNIVALSFSDLPPGVSADLDTNSVTGAGSATLTVTVSNSVAPGNYAFNLTGSSAGVTHTTAVNLIVGNFSLSAAPATQAILPGAGTTYTITILTNDNFSGVVNLGLSGLPSGAGANFNPPLLNGNGNSTLTITTMASTSPGIYPLTIYGTNGDNIATTMVTLDIATFAINPGALIWTSNSGADKNWSNPSNWTNIIAGGYGPPGADNDVIFTNFGAVADSALTASGSGIVIPASINNFADTNFTIESLTNLNNAAVPNYQNLQIAAGSTVTVNGNLQIGGGTEFDFGGNSVVNFTAGGSDAKLQINGAVIVNATSAATGSHNAILDLSGLDVLAMNNSRLTVGVEGGGSAKRATGIIYLAKTNNLTITSGGNVAFYIGHNKSVAPTIAPAVYLGISNAIFMADNTGIMVGRANTPGSLLAFNPAFIGQNPTAYFRGANNSSRIANWNVGDNSANANNSANPTSGTNDFSGGAINALVNVMQLGVSCPAGASASGNGTGTFTFDSGTLDVNTLQLGVDTGNSGVSAGIGVMNVNGGRLNVNSNLQLGVFIAGSGGIPEGVLNINGGKVQSQNITGNGGFAAINFNSGALDSESGMIENISTLNIGKNGIAESALLENAADISVSNAITIAPNGTLAGNTFITAPDLVVNGAISPGVNDAGAITDDRSVAFGADGHFAVDVQDANGAPGAGWDFLQMSGALDIQATAENPFTIDLQSLADSGAGAVTNFNGNTNYDWTIATADGGIVNFAADTFAVNISQFQNALGGGYFYVRTNGNSLILSFANNHSPAISNAKIINSNLIFGGSNGAPGGTYLVLASTNLALPLSNWLVLATNQFDLNGNFSFTNLNVTNAASQFFRLQLTR